jgi:hypothetical protein
MFVNSDGQIEQITEFTDEYAVYWPDDDELIECDDLHEAVGIIRYSQKTDGVAQLKKRIHYVTNWTDCEESCGN